METNMYRMQVAAPSFQKGRSARSAGKNSGLPHQWRLSASKVITPHLSLIHISEPTRPRLI
eukprot:5639121-Amphidinium_carterae.1